MTEHTTFTARTGGAPRPADSAEREAVQQAVRLLRKPRVVRERCANITAAATAGDSSHFWIERAQLPEVVKRVARITRERFPGLLIPPHSRWRHFEVGGIDRKAALDARLAGIDAAERARIYIDLAVISVLLDAGAGNEWAYVEQGSGRRYLRSEGLAVASFNAFMAGQFSSDRRVPLRVDGLALERIDAPMLAALFQVRADNPLVGLEGRVMLLQRLGKALRLRPDVFGEPARPGRLFDLLGHAQVGGQGSTVQKVPVKRVAAANILRALLKAFGGIWPSGQVLGGKPVGDVWAHPRAGGSGLDAGRVPFHKLSQWLTYSLVEPFEWAGIAVDGLDELTGLPEYRNGGLFIDAGVIVPRDAGFSGRVYTPSDPWIIEWRALTVTLLDELLREMRLELDLPQLTMAGLLEGGSWAAGREIASERRPGGPPPVRVASNGTIF